MTLKEWLQTLNAGRHTASILAAVVAAIVFDTPGVLVLGVMCLIARTEANRWYREVLRRQDVLRDILQAKLKPEDEIREQVLKDWEYRDGN